MRLYIGSAVPYSTNVAKPHHYFWDVGFGEDYELLAATPDPLGFTVIGRCEEGSGVGLTLHGEPVELAGWEHFR